MAEADSDPFITVEARMIDISRVASLTRRFGTVVANSTEDVSMTEIEHHTIRANGIRQYYMESGEGAPVVLCSRAERIQAVYVDISSSDNLRTYALRLSPDASLSGLVNGRLLSTSRLYG